MVKFEHIFLNLIFLFVGLILPFQIDLELARVIILTILCCAVVLGTKHILDKIEIKHKKNWKIIDAENPPVNEALPKKNTAKETINHIYTGSKATIVTGDRNTTKS